MRLILNLRDDAPDDLIDFAVQSVLKMSAKPEDWSDSVTFGYMDISTGDYIYTLHGRKNKRSVSVTDQEIL